MAKVYVSSEPQDTQPVGDWAVRLGSPRTGEILSSGHRKKSAAMREGRKQARKRSDRGATLYAFNTSSNAYEVVHRYGGGH